MRQVVDDFLELHRKLADPRTAASQCRIATTDLVTALNAAGVESHPVWVRAHRTEPREAHSRASDADRHMIVRLPDGGFVDVTRRQYQRGCSHPRYYSSEPDLAHDWREIDDGPVDGAAEDELWRALDLAPWSPGRAGKGLLVRRGELHCWSVDAEDAPHHHGGLVVLGLLHDEIESYLVLDACGLVTMSPDPNDEFAAKRIAKLDPRLRVETGWQF